MSQAGQAELKPALCTFTYQALHRVIVWRIHVPAQRLLTAGNTLTAGPTETSETDSLF